MNLKFTHHSIWRLTERLPEHITEKDVIKDIVKNQGAYLIKDGIKEIYGQLARYMVSDKGVIITILTN